MKKLRGKKKKERGGGKNVDENVVGRTKAPEERIHVEGGYRRDLKHTGIRGTPVARTEKRLGPLGQ